MPLSSLECRKLKPTEKPRKVSDGEGLHLLVKPNGSKLWRLAYRFDGKQKTLAFGSYPDVTLAEARRRRDAAKEVLASNRDPAVHSLPDEISDRFETVAREWHKNQSRSWGLRHSETTLARLERDIFSQFGDRRISDIEAPTILQAIRKVESRGALDISKRLLNMVGAIFRYGIATGRASRDPAADLRGALKKSPRVKHMAAIPLREHTKKNVEQHASFLAEHPIDSHHAEDAMSWMRGLPLFLELEGFHAVHACWSQQSIKMVLKVLPNATLTEEAVQWPADKDHPLFQPVETLVKGPEAKLPKGYLFKDKGGHERGEVRVAWWERNARTWKEIAISVPDAEKQLPNASLPAAISSELYPTDAKPVFFGHYWMTGKVVLQAPNALCLDYAAGLGGPLLAYTFEEPGAALDLGRVTAFGG